MRKCILIEATEKSKRHGEGNITKKVGSGA